MKKLKILLIVIITLLVHSLIGTIIYIATNEDDDFAAYYAIGIIGWIVSIKIQHFSTSYDIISL